MTCGHRICLLRQFIEYPRVVEVRDDGAEHRSSLVHLADRIGALAGSLDMGRDGLRAEIPCA